MKTGPAMILRLAIVATLRDAAPVGVRAEPAFPIRAVSKRAGGGWIRILGRLLSAILSRWPAERLSGVGGAE